MTDVRAYADSGISLTTIREQRNAAGPLSFIWMALGARRASQDALFGARIAVLLSWLLLIVLVIGLARHSKWADLWYFGLLATMTFPHSLTASATALTEGPALLFAYAGVIAWIEATSRKTELGFAPLAVAISGAFSMGLAVTCRQYFLALLPSVGVVVFLTLLADRPTQPLLSSCTRMAIPLAFAALPPIFLILIWHGITSPSMASGASYSNYQAGAGLALFRPIEVLFYTALYLVPFSFPAMWNFRPKSRWPLLLCAFAGGALAMHFREHLLNPGPLNSFIGFVSRIPGAASLLFWLIASVATYNAIAVIGLLRSERARIRTCTPVIFAVLMVVFFILEQFGVGGNIPFYDRYILQLAPFLGIIGFSIYPRLTPLRIWVLAGLLVLSQGMLWRYAFIAK